ncbi:hypothetical protein [Mycobacterium sp.]|uniref:hypothetical protein n=1 Tax=Mycobacterium sp. TaxID=1785 RepID=UPI0011FC600B|nr:hypothetical protein [Mycobacterium sp.]TAM64958.1 MAG: hypothetical protein EPN51_21615 [Mycobacterium sp.]
MWVARNSGLLAPTSLSSAENHTDTGTSVTWTHDIEPNAKVILAVFPGGFYVTNGGVGVTLDPSGSAKTFTGVGSAVFLYNGSNYFYVSLLYLLNPPPGLQTLQAKIAPYTGNPAYGNIAGAASFTYANCSSVANGAPAINPTRPLTITGAPNKTVFNVFSGFNAANNVFTSTSPNQLYLRPSGSAYPLAIADGIPGAASPAFDCVAQNATTIQQISCTLTA